MTEQKSATSAVRRAPGGRGWSVLIDELFWSFRPVSIGPEFGTQRAGSLPGFLMGEGSACRNGCCAGGCSND